MRIETVKRFELQPSGRAADQFLRRRQQFFDDFTAMHHLGFGKKTEQQKTRLVSADPGSVVAVRQNDVVEVILIGSFESVRIPIANLGVLANGAQQIVPAVKAKKIWHLDIVVETGLVQWREEFEPVWCDFTRKTDAAAANERAVLHPCRAEQQTRP